MFGNRQADGGGYIFHTESLGRNIKGEQGGMGSGCSSTQHPLYFLRTHSRAKSRAFSSWDGVIFFSKSSLNLAPISFPLVPGNANLGGR